MTLGTQPDKRPAADTIEQLAISTIRTLSMDAVQAANSGHPGTPMALAPVAYKLWRDYLRFDPELPVWANRDRFVLSVGTPRRCCTRCCTGGRGGARGPTCWPTHPPVCPR
jgi:Transketolase, thiamine diphosphate binding domain